MMVNAKKKSSNSTFWCGFMWRQEMSKHMPEDSMNETNHKWNTNLEFLSNEPRQFFNACNDELQRNGMRGIRILPNESGLFAFFSCKYGQELREIKQNGKNEEE